MKVSAFIAARIEAIAADRSSGAAELGLRAAETLALARPEELAEAAQAVVRAQPSMASVYNAAQAALAGRIDGFIERLHHSSERIARAAAGLVRGKAVLTHSYSSTVLRALREGGPSRVICTESLPGGEGARMAAALRGELIPDTAVYRSLAAVEIVVTGADALTPDSVINKIGTAALALCARERGIPAWVLCGSDKEAGAGWNPALGSLFEAAPRAWFTGVISDR